MSWPSPATLPNAPCCTRFIPPEVPEQMTGAWRDYYRHWRAMTRDTLDPRLLELAEPLARLCPPARILDKAVYSAFADPRLAPALRRKGIGTLIVTGGETDVCVLSTVMAAVDLGFRVVLPGDALCSARDKTHDCPDDPLSRALHQSGGDHLDRRSPARMAVMTSRLQPRRSSLAAGFGPPSSRRSPLRGAAYLARRAERSVGERA